MVAGATMSLVAGLATAKATESGVMPGLEFKTRLSSNTAENAAVCSLSEAKVTEAMPLPVRPNTLAGKLAARVKDSITELSAVPLLEKAVAVHCGCETWPEVEESPARVNPKDCNGVANFNVKLTGWPDPACVKKLGAEGA